MKKLISLLILLCASVFLISSCAFVQDQTEEGSDAVIDNNGSVYDEPEADDSNPDEPAIDDTSSSYEEMWADEAGENYSDYWTFLKTVTADQIAQVETLREKLGEEAGSLKTYKTTEDKNAIARIIEAYKYVKMQPTDQSPWGDDAEKFTVSFTYNDGTVRNLYFYNGISQVYLGDGANGYYKLNHIVDLDEGDKYSISYGFNSSVADGRLCSYDPTLSSSRLDPICHIPLEEIRFTVVDDPSITPEARRDYALVTEFGNVYFITNTVFFYSSSGYCQLAFGNIDDIIEKYKPTESALLLSDSETWLNQVTANDIKEVKTVRYSGLLTEEFKYIKRTSNKSIIESLLDDYRLVTLDDSYVGFEPGPDSFTIEFYMNDGSVKRMDFTGGAWYNGCLCDVVPSLDKYNFRDVSESYSLLTFESFKKVYYHSLHSSLAEGILIGRINPEMLEFRKYEIEGFDEISPYFYYFDTRLGRINIYNEYYLLYNGVVYEIVNTDFACLGDFYLLKEAYESKYNDGRVAFIECYLGRFESGAIVSMITDDYSFYTEALWREKVGDYYFQYYDGNRIMVLYENEFYTLPEAYEKGYLTDADLMNIWLIF